MSMIAARNCRTSIFFQNVPIVFRMLCATKTPEFESLEVDDSKMPPIPQYNIKRDESLNQKKARLLYQSRKRGMLENCLLLSTFAAKYLNGMTIEETEEYDKLINLPLNDWDIYYWATGHKPVPNEFDNNIMKLLKEHVSNKDKEQRFRQPDLHEH
ncbi:succinate dehydrogenase assembly factor 2-B, mitochondrial-like [Ctenocephalides felis]|uniref:succinate dehydrogenase assembly factor 2-B, mitochondrial-like n=1 Tax=Ctenocephalides felis TaxID=7515 RepID=UPI000E6E20BC|nr:succinate dehydrogenase assembly factor 2-B, mitochondrial-like [Ctenocephalides felis]XP_026470904.1 succinate dehydrogenase assembly factor 2-B, mitochondrial-like [Ctenocephalides felis]XP_026475550.1 succinate dehydrogenase assembly factor 2-B, mitochondrial-like [Ctenocephalides felis]